MSYLGVFLGLFIGIRERCTTYTIIPH